MTAPTNAFDKLKFELQAIYWRCLIFSLLEVIVLSNTSTEESP